MPSRDRLRDHTRHSSSCKQTTSKSRPVTLHLLVTQTICSRSLHSAVRGFSKRVRPAGALAAVGLRHTASANIGGYPDCGNDRSPDMSYVCDRTPMPFLAPHQNGVLSQGARELPRGVTSVWLGHYFSRRSTIDTLHRLARLFCAPLQAASMRCTTGSSLRPCTSVTGGRFLYEINLPDCCGRSKGISRMHPTPAPLPLSRVVYRPAQQVSLRHMNEIRPVGPPYWLQYPQMQPYQFHFRPYVELSWQCWSNSSPPCRDTRTSQKWATLDDLTRQLWLPAIAVPETAGKRLNATSTQGHARFH
jgi:hypothetical protein